MGLIAGRFRLAHKSLFQKSTVLVLRRPEGASKDDPGGAGVIANVLWSIPFGGLRADFRGPLLPQRAP